MIFATHAQINCKDVWYGKPQANAIRIGIYFLSGLVYILQASLKSLFFILFHANTCVSYSDLHTSTAHSVSRLNDNATLYCIFDRVREEIKKNLCDSLRVSHVIWGDIWV